MLKSLKLALISIILTTSSPSQGDHLTVGDKFIYGGTAALYYTASDVNFFKSKTNPLFYSQATLFGSYTLNNFALRGEAMLIENHPRMNYLFADVSGGSLNTLYGVRAGKLHRRVGLYDNVRFNPVRRRFVFLPTTLYYPAAEEWSTSTVGGQVYFKKSLFSGNGNIYLEVDRGIPWQADFTTKHQFSQIYGGQEIDDVDAFELSASTFVNAVLEYQNWKFMISYNPDTKWKYTSVSHATIPSNEAHQETIWVGIKYRNNKWLASVEGYTGTITTNYPLLPVNDAMLGYYTYAITLGYDITDKWQVSTFTSQIFLEAKSDVFTTGNLLKRETTRLSQRDSAFTTRYRLTENWSVRAEAHYFNGNPINLLGFGDDNNLSINEEKDWWLTTVGVEFTF